MMLRSYEKRLVMFTMFLLICSCCIVACGSADECTVNRDCIKLKGNNFICTQAAGVKKCVKKTSNCPTGCSSDSDCSKCTGGKTACISGQCQQAVCPSSCTIDTDCANCTDNKTSCVSGVCAEKAGPTCPASCTQDSECASCSDNKTSCVSGVCAEKTGPTCPASCTQDSECASCSDNKTSCVSGVCAEKTGPTCPASCAQDNECTSCTGGKNFCVKGVCDVKPGPTCPSTCAQDSECATCTEGKTSCVGGVCAKKTGPTCPASCTQDSECATCTGGKTSCVGGVCAKKTVPTCPSSCAQDSECTSCTGGKNFCIKGVCDVKPGPTCPSSCTSDLDCAPCPGTQVKCSNGVCSTGGQTCPPSCTNSAQCAPCGAGFTCNAQGTCAAPQTPGVGEDCTTSNTCSAQGFICLLITENPRKASCFQDCGPNSQVCGTNTDGRTQCVTVGTSQNGSAIAVCLAEVGVGKKCGYNGALQARCLRGQNPPLYCSNTGGVCKAAIIQKKVGDTCNKQNDNTEPIRICENASKLVCNQATGKCVTAQIAQEGEVCDSTGANLGKQVICDPSKKDLTCLRYDQAGENQRCQYLCNPQAPSQCAHRVGLTCAQILTGGGGVCMDLTCTQDSECAFTGYKCENASSGGKICLPPAPAGPNAFGALCGAPTRTNGCKAGNFCLQQQGKTQGFCSINCTQAGVTCPSVGTTASVCSSINSTTKACLFPCGSPGQTCPTGLACNTSFKFCLAP